MFAEKNVPLRDLNTFGIVAKAQVLYRIRSAQDLCDWIESGQSAGQTPLVLGGGSNIVLTGDVKSPVLKMEIAGMALVDETPKSWTVQAGAGVGWHELVQWTLQNGYYGLENLALIPGSVGASPVQNIGAYGVELQDCFDSLDAVDLSTGKTFTLNAQQCAFGYRDSVFKHAPARPGDVGLAGRAVITQVRFSLPKKWRAITGYADIEKYLQARGLATPNAQQIFDAVVAIRQSKLPDPKVLGNAGSFFKNPVVSSEQCQDIIAREPTIAHYKLHDGTVKLAAAWLIDACGWRGKTMGAAAVYEKQALVLVNQGMRDGKAGATGGEVMTLAKAIQTSVYERFGILLEPEPVVI
jgi:UDP-N-acetylmuramate dehydrogenase